MSSNLLFGITDQVGGNIGLPLSEIHIPRIQGANYTLPAGLAIRGNRKFIWTVDTSIPGVLGILNPNSNTPTIQFDPVVFSRPFLNIKCTIIGQPSRSKEYVLFTSATSTTGTGISYSNSITPNQGIVLNPQINISNNSNLVTNTDSYILEWGLPLYINNTSYLIEIWNSTLNNWDFFAVTNNQQIPITNPLTTYRIKAVYPLYVHVNNPFVTYGIGYNDLLSLTASKNSAVINNISTIRNYNQTPSTATFYTSIEAVNIDSIGRSTLNIISTINGYNQTANPNIFFTSINYLNTDSIDKPNLNTLSALTGFNQNPNGLQFWTQLTGT
jgi:hypothetical protein